MKKLLFSFLLAVFFIPLTSPLWAEPTPAQAPWGDALLTARILDDGKVMLLKNFLSMGYVEPQIFTDGWKIVPFQIQVKDSRFDEIATLPQGGQVGLTASSTITGSSLHVHYRMTPLQDVTVISARAAFYLTYKDWLGAPYQVGPVTGSLPAEVNKGFLITKSDAQPVTLGPVQPNDLTVQLNTDKLTTTLEDDRTWGSYFSFTLNHNEPVTPAWVWKAGDVKDLDFTITFNRQFTEPPASQAPAKPGDITGYWYGTADIEGYPYRSGILIQKEKNGTLKMMDSGVDDYEDNASQQKVSWNGKDLLIKDIYLDDGLTVEKLSLDKSGKILSGTFRSKDGTVLIKKDKDYAIRYERGLNFTLPRVDENGNAVTDYTYQLPQTLTDGWAVGDLNQSSLNPAIVEKGIHKILTQKFPHIQSVVVAQHGRLLLDEYFEGFGPGDFHQMQSTSKSVFGLLFGIGDDQGLVNPDEKLYDFFPEYRKKADWDPRKDKITLGHCLSMTSGFACDDFFPDTDCHQIMWKSPDWLDFVLSQPMNHMPGEHWAYCNDCLEPPGAILARQSRMSVPDFAQKYLFGPLGFQNTYWFQNIAPNGLTDIAGSISLRPRDMAKLGQLVLQKGKWNGQRIVSEKWLEQCLKPQAPPPNYDAWYDNYGYLWWIKEMPYKNGKIHVVFTAGRGGQYMFAVPDLDLVCAVTGGNYSTWQLERLEQEFFKSYILGAAK